MTLKLTETSSLEQVESGESAQNDLHPWKINMEPENTPLEEENHLPNHHLQVLCQSSGVYLFQVEEL